MAGSLVKSGKSKQAKEFLALDLSGFGNGLYVIRLMDQFGRRYFVKVFKEGELIILKNKMLISAEAKLPVSVTYI